jgi:cell envelope opacity-associated protein A
MGNVFDEMEKLNKQLSPSATPVEVGAGDSQNKNAGEVYSTTESSPTKSSSQEKPSKRDSTVSRNHTSVTPLMPPSHRGITVAGSADKVIDHLRKAVREIGKEAATHRFTVAEKRALAELVYVYQKQGIRTSENEVTRIAINFILSDYESAGKGSVLDQVIRKLNE